MAALRSAVCKVGIDPSKFCAHSFRIESCSERVEDVIIKILGKRQRLAYLLKSLDSSWHFILEFCAYDLQFACCSHTYHPYVHSFGFYISG